MTLLTLLLGDSTSAESLPLYTVKPSLNGQQYEQQLLPGKYTGELLMDVGIDTVRFGRRIVLDTWWVPPLSLETPTVLDWFHTTTFSEQASRRCLRPDLLWVLMHLIASGNVAPTVLESREVARSLLWLLCAADTSLREKLVQLYPKFLANASDQARAMQASAEYAGALLGVGLLPWCARRSELCDGVYRIDDAVQQSDVSTRINDLREHLDLLRTILPSLSAHWALAVRRAIEAAITIFEEEVARLEAYVAAHAVQQTLHAAASTEASR